MSYQSDNHERLEVMLNALNNRWMTIYRVRIGFHNPSGLTFRQLDEILEPQRFCRSRVGGSQFRYYMEYEYETEVRDLCAVCSLAYSQACRVNKCPLVLVEEKKGVSLSMISD